MRFTNLVVLVSAACSMVWANLTSEPPVTSTVPPFTPAPLVNNSNDFSSLVTLQLKAFDAFEIFLATSNLGPDVTRAVATIQELIDVIATYCPDCSDELWSALEGLSTQMNALHRGLMNLAWKFRTAVVW